MSQTLGEINTPLNGTPGAFPNQVPGANGGAGGDADETFSNDAFANNGANEIAFTPTATGGTGTLAEFGANGTNGVASPVASVEVFSPGTDGGPSGRGGDGGSASITMTNISAGTSTVPSATGVEINARASGNSAGGGNAGGSGGSGGFNAVGTIGAQGGNGAAGGAGGDGGGATVTVSGFVSFDSGAVGSDIFTSAVGAVGGTGFGAGSGGQGALPSNGGMGGAGGSGGSVSDVFTSSTVVDNSFIFVSSTAEGGVGEVGGEGGQAGDSLSIGTNSFQTRVYGVNGAGGAGGAGGNASATISNDTLIAPVVNIDVAITAGPGNTGGISPFEASVNNSSEAVTGSPSGAAGAAGATGFGQIVFTGNTITAGQGLNGSIPFNQPGTLVLEMSIIDLGLTNGNVTKDLDGASGGNLQFSGNSFIGEGQSTLNLELAGTGSIMIDTAANTIGIAGSPDNALTGFSTIDLDNNSTVVAGAGALTLNFASDPDTLIFTPTSGTVTVNHATTTNMELDFQGFGAALNATTLQNDTTVSGGNTLINIGSGEIILTGFTAAIPAADETISPQCFRIGTRIATLGGTVAVEDLTVGEMVLTHDGERLPITWIGRRHFDCRRHPSPDTVSPIRVAAHAFGEHQPGRDLFLSPDHAIYAEGVLIPVKYLIDGINVARVRTDDVTYYHVELPHHAILLAEGLGAESYLDIGDQTFFTHPGRRALADPALIWETLGAAPLCVAGPILDRVRNILTARAMEAEAA